MVVAVWRASSSIEICHLGKGLIVMIFSCLLLVSESRILSPHRVHLNVIAWCCSPMVSTLLKEEMGIIAQTSSEAEQMMLATGAKDSDREVESNPKIAFKFRPTENATSSLFNTEDKILSQLQEVSFFRNSDRSSRWEVHTIKCVTGHEKYEWSFGPRECCKGIAIKGIPRCNINDSAW